MSFEENLTLFLKQTHTLTSEMDDEFSKKYLELQLRLLYFCFNIFINIFPLILFLMLNYFVIAVHE